MGWRLLLTWSCLPPGTGSPRRSQPGPLQALRGWRTGPWSGATPSPSPVSCPCEWDPAEGADTDPSLGRCPSLSGGLVRRSTLCAGSLGTPLSLSSPSFSIWMLEDPSSSSSPSHPLALALQDILMEGPYYLLEEANSGPWPLTVSMSRGAGGCRASWCPSWPTSWRWSRPSAGASTSSLRRPVTSCSELSSTSSPCRRLSCTTSTSTRTTREWARARAARAFSPRAQGRVLGSALWAV